MWFVFQALASDTPIPPRPPTVRLSEGAWQVKVGGDWVDLPENQRPIPFDGGWWIVDEQYDGGSGMGCHKRWLRRAHVSQATLTFDALWLPLGRGCWHGSAVDGLFSVGRPYSPFLSVVPVGADRVDLKPVTADHLSDQSPPGSFYHHLGQVSGDPSLPLNGTWTWTNSVLVHEGAPAREATAADVSFDVDDVVSNRIAEPVVVVAPSYGFRVTLTPGASLWLGQPDRASVCGAAWSRCAP